MVLMVRVLLESSLLRLQHKWLSMRRQDVRERHCTLAEDVRIGLLIRLAHRLIRGSSVEMESHLGHSASSHRFGGCFASAFWTSSRLRYRVLTIEHLDWMLLAVQAGSSVITLDVRFLAIAAGDHWDNNIFI